MPTDGNAATEVAAAGNTDDDPVEEAPTEDDDITESDLSEDYLSAIAQVVVTATDWTTETILSQLTKGNIDLTPKFQRRDAWNSDHKSKFIESLFLGLPIPQLVLAEQRERRGHFLVIDGKQRLLSLMKFAAPDGNQELSPEETDEKFEALRLTGLTIKKELNGLTLADIEKRPDLNDDLTAFQNQAIRTVVVKNWPNEELLYLLFLRLNTGSIKLSPQELRQALHPGKFMQFVDDFASKSAGLKAILKKSRPDFRMRDVEILIRFYAFTNYLSEYNGNLKTFLDDTCRKMNERWNKDEKSIRSQATSFETAVGTTFSVFGREHAFRKWNGEEFERRTNRAVIDIMTFYFAVPDIAIAALEQKEDVIRAFKNACDTNQTFKTSLETTTKSLNATYERLSIWGTDLGECLGMTVPVPQLDQEGHIIPPVRG